MDKFSSEAICAIIGACGQAGVRRFLYDGLDINFADEVGQPSQPQPTGPWGNLPVLHNHLPPAEMGAQQESEAFDVQTKESLEAAREANLLLEDPSAWERQQLDGLFE